MLAERKNQTIGKIIHKILNQVEITTGNPSSQWVSYLPIIVKTINEKVRSIHIEPKPMEKAEPITFNNEHKVDLLNIDDKVRVALDEPKNVAGNKLIGSFRSGDICWNPVIRTVKFIYSKTDEPSFQYFLNVTNKTNKKYY